MANGPFGNPLSTGIALSFEVDMTPYREMHKRKLLAAKEKEEDQKKKQQQYADILKNITPPDASKIHKKYMPEVQNQYAELIDSAMGYINKNDMASLHKHMFEFDSNAKKAVQATENYKNYVNSDANKTFKSIEAIRSMEDDNTSIGDIFDKYQNDVEYGDGYLFWATIERPDVLGNANKVLQGTEKMFMTDDAGNYISTGKVGPRGKELYRKSIKDPDKFFENQATLLKNSAGGNRLLMEYGGIKASQLDERQADGRQLRDVLADKYVRENLSPKVYGEEGLDPNVPRADKTDYTFGEDSIGDVAFSGTTPSGITSEAPTPEQEQQALTNELTSTIQRYLDDAKTADPNNVEDKLSDPITKNFLANYGLKMEVPFTYGEQVEVLTEGGTSLGVFDPTSQSFVQDLTNIVLEKGANVMDNTPNITPETTVEEFLKPESNAFTVQMAGGKTPKTDWSIPGGTTVILAGDDGSVEVKLRNDITLQGGKFQKAANYEDKSGKVDTYYDIMFPVEYQGNDDLFADFFGDDDALSQFKLKNRNQLPKSLYVKEDENTFNTLLSILQTRETKGKMNKSVLQKAMDKYMKPLSAAGTQSSGSSVSITSSDIQKMSGMKYDDFNNASNKAWVDEIAKKIRSMSNLDDLWKQTGKRGTPNGLSNAELLAGFVESGKTSLLTGTPSGFDPTNF